MNTHRREFLQLSLAAGALAAMRTNAWAQAAAAPMQKKPGSGKSLLILGGTGFLGPAIVEAAQARGHTVTLFNRGKTRPGLFPDLEKLQGDRDPNKGEGLKALEGRKFDTVFDDCGYYPRMVSASAALLAPNVKQYVYVSSISAYAKNDVVGADETAAVGTMPDPTLETMGPSYEYYGPLKALCEQAAEEALPGRAAIVRPGYIVGPGDPTDRFTYWPVRIDKGGEVLVPGEPTDPIQVIDVRDLAEWMVSLAENNTTGVFNACGPAGKLAWGTVIEACQAATTSKSTLRWVKYEDLERLQVQELPIWSPYIGEAKGFHTWSNARAMKAGLKFRSIQDTTKDTLAWFKKEPAERQAKLRAGPSPEREAEILKSLG